MNCKKRQRLVPHTMLLLLSCSFVKTLQPYASLVLTQKNHIRPPPSPSCGIQISSMDRSAGLAFLSRIVSPPFCTRSEFITRHYTQLFTDYDVLHLYPSHHSSSRIDSFDMLVTRLRIHLL